MPDINITVAHKVAVSDTQSIVCDNSDYTVHWTLDEEWSAYDTKTMRTIYMDGTFEDAVFSGNEIALPVCTVPGAVQIGLFAGNIRASRMAILRALPSVRSAAGAPDDPEPDVYDQLMERMAQLESPDWAQNDPSAKDYVRNRTHYVSRESKALVPEQEVTTAVQNNFNFAILNNADPDALRTLYDSEDGTTFDVVFDGASYSCKWFEQGGKRIPVFGNFAIFEPNVTDTGEPFVFSVEPAGDVVWIAIACKVAGTHTVAVSYQQDVVHTLDPKYIKDMYYTRSVKQPLVPEKELNNGDDPVRIQADCPSEGQTIIVTYDGVKYERKAQSFMGYVVVGNTALSGAGTTATDTGEPFYLRFWERHCGGDMVLVQAVFADGTTSHTLSAVTIVEQVHTIPDKYMPSWVMSNEHGAVMFYAEADGIDTKVSIPSPPMVSGFERCFVLIRFYAGGRKGKVKTISTPYGAFNICSVKTGAQITDEEIPYGNMLVAITGTEAYCLNPR